MFSGGHSAWRSTFRLALVAGVVLAGLSRPVRATIQFDEHLQLSGNFETQNLLRVPEGTEAEFTQQRNTVRLRVDWDWLQNGRFMDRFDLPFVKESKFYFLYRGAYDSFYDMAPGYRQTGQAREDDIIGGPAHGNEVGTLRRGCDASADPFGTSCLRDGLYSSFTSRSRRSLKIENVLREVYTDITLENVPLTLRIGRQQVIWGEADQFRLMDIWNPVDVSWRFPTADTFDDFRVPLWLIKGIWDFGVVGPFANTFMEVVYNPFDFQSGQKVGWLPRPNSLPFPNPLRPGQLWAFNTPRQNPDGSLTDQHAPATPYFDLASVDFNTGTITRGEFMQNTNYHKGDFHRNPEDASEVGLRFHGVTPQGIEGTVSYIYGRGKFVGNAPAFGVKVEEMIYPGVLPNYDNGVVVPLDGSPYVKVADVFVKAKIVHPYVHVFGITGNYFDADFTNGVLRMEMAYSLGQPYATSQADKLLPVHTPFGREVLGQTSPVGFTKRDVFAGMLGIDRPSWIRLLNNKGTFFLSSQLFWVHLPGHDVSKLHGFSSADARPYFTPMANDPGAGMLHNSGGFGVWSNSSPWAGQIERIQSAQNAPEDNYLPWEFMLTGTATTFYRGGTLAPQLVTLFDPVNLWAMEALELKYFYTNNIVFTVQQRQVFPLKTPMNDPWFVGRFGRRGELGLRVTYQF